MKRFVSGQPYWWQWFTILSLDAAVVAVVWQAVFARVGDVVLSWPRIFVLGSSVWLAYAADRWIEGWRLAPEAVQTQRHYFAVHWRWPQMIAWCIVLAVDLTVSVRQLSLAEFKAGLLLLGPVLVYLLSHQLLHRNHPWRLPKEICVALLMAGGALVFVVPQMTLGQAAIWMLGFHFGILCFSNCVLISVWENEVDQSHGQDSLAQRLGQFTKISRAIPLMLAIECGFVAADLQGGELRRAYLCIAGSGLLLAGVDYLEIRAGRQLARVLADVVLLTPVVGLLIH